MEEVILVRDNQKIPWGFRLTGGRDFSSPLTVVKINGSSIAEKRGLHVGDIIVEINNEKMNHLTHGEVQRFILEAGNFLKIMVLRGSSPAIPPVLTPIRGMTPVSPLPIEKYKGSASVGSVDSLYDDDSFELLGHSEDDEYEIKNREPTEEEIEQMLLENAEVIEESGKNVIGVNFRRFIPKCDFIKDSAVFQVLQEEQVHKELSEKEQLKRCPHKRFSTFLEIPDRPIPNPKPKTEEDAKKDISDVHFNEKEKSDEESVREHIIHVQVENENSSVNEDKSSEDEPSNETNETIEIHETETKIESIEIEDNTEPDVSSKTTTEESVTEPNGEKDEFLEQLDTIKNTLNSLQELPTLIQSQLISIQEQINKLLTKKVQKEENKKEQNEPDNRSDQVSESVEYEDEPQTVENEQESEAQNEDLIEDYTDTQTEEDNAENSNNTKDQSEENAENRNNTNDQSEENNENTDHASQVDDSCTKKRPTCPLTPLPRPVVLPGGRIWRKPKDAFNEEFIAETLISQAEVLLGSTLGVNFRKYEPPKFDLSNSAVYKLIHNIEKKKVGLEDRDTIPSVQDYYQSPITEKHIYLSQLADKASQPVGEDDTDFETSY